MASRVRDELRGELSGLGRLMLSVSYEDACDKVRAMSELGVVSTLDMNLVLERLHDWGFGMTMAARKRDLKAFMVGWTKREEMIKDIGHAFDELNPQKFMVLVESRLPDEFVEYVMAGRAELDLMKAEVKKALAGIVADVTGEGLKQREAEVEKALAGLASGDSGEQDCGKCPDPIRDGCDASQKQEWAARKQRKRSVAP